MQISTSASTPDYFDVKRRTAVLVYADGTIITDDPSLQDVSNPLHTVLVNREHSPGDTEMPHRIYVGCSFCGDLHLCRLEKAGEDRVEFDWIYRMWMLVAEIRDERHPDLPARDEVAFTIRVRIDGRA